MPTSLDGIRAKFLGRLSVVDSAFERHLASARGGFRSDKFALQEGIISQLWQYWCAFCRDTVVASTKGAATRSGNQTSSPYAGNSDSEIAFIAKQLANRQNITNIRPLSGSHLEPTWGDVNKLGLILSGIGCSNGRTMASAFGAGTLILDLQICRNACAHLNSQNINIINSVRTRYNSTNFQHPSDIMFWIDPATSDFVWRSWICEMDIISDLAVA